MIRKITKSFEETQKFGEEMAAKAGDFNVVTLQGDLGSGKTTFVQGLAKGLGIEKKIISPTFIIMRTYEIPEEYHEYQGYHGKENGKPKQKKRTFYHVDLYRIADEKDVEGLGLIELMNDSENLVVIEWPEKIENLLPTKRLNLSFEYLEHEGREIIVDN